MKPTNDLPFPLTDFNEMRYLIELSKTNRLRLQSHVCIFLAATLVAAL